MGDSILESSDVNGSPDGPDLRQYLSVVASYWRGIVAILLSTVLLAFGWTLLQPRIYQASSSGLVVAAGGDNITMALAGDNLAKSKATSYKSIALTVPVARRVIEELNLSTSANALLERISVTVPTNTAEIRINATSTDPEQAQDLANAWVAALAEQATDIESVAPSGSKDAFASEPAVQIAPLGKAVLPTAPISPNTKLALALGGVVGMALGLGYALLRNHLDRRIRSVEAIERLGAAVVGTIPRDPRSAAGRRIIETGGIDHADRESHPFIEALRELRTNLSYTDVDNPPRVIVVTSSVPGEGKSTVAANLAVAIAGTGRRTVLIEGDLRRPVLTEFFGLPSGAGLTDVLSGSADIDDVLQPYGPVPELSVLGAGRIPPNPSELLGSKAMRSLLTELSRDAVVLIDSPPLLPVTDAAILARIGDGALVAVKAGSTTVDELGRALDNLRRVEGRILGTILNQVPTRGAGASRYGYYGQYYYYTSEETPAADSRSAKKASKLPQPAEPAERTTPSRRIEGRVPVQAPDLTPRQALSPAIAPMPAATSQIPHVPGAEYGFGGGPSPEDSGDVLGNTLASRSQMRHLRRNQ
ncbi:chromosome partitioning protein [Zafaria cholistanensis]|uniref:non-specific protein-tyrosine kinase n=1 Tax=Zafaria cholistanensis TaxID=1682741 RepID=A0A5A7NP42_9MICC|nr:polysaccharide biosynthesis tyrosine autokinase [Zafaria cholistanensis]GER22683.1 chromosome partitioning protein [Zafaria cholistanensis]